MLLMVISHSRLSELNEQRPPGEAAGAKGRIGNTRGGIRVVEWPENRTLNSSPIPQSFELLRTKSDERLARGPIIAPGLTSVVT
jgi:hypothetical protein